MVTLEIGGGFVDQTQYIARGVSGVLNGLRHIGVVAGRATPPPEQIVIQSILTFRPHVGGILVSEAPPLGGTISAGEVLGRVYSPQTFEELEVIRSPLEQGIMLLSHLTQDTVWPGDYGYLVGDMSTVES